ncbi:uncharacterized protein [Dermacentor andersoni]|uniref:uncharacterized protein isoform X1 n=1 Tax=Dermacentor andersoni TaxID=34620 RepID=UPI002415E245|nr:uncharacterized protein LOC126547754 isoform X1 [Dermacentor andersoni]
MIYPLLILAALLALSCSETDQLKPPEPCEDKACVEYCMKVLGGPEFNVTGKCVKNETGAQSCSCRRRTYCTVEACARSCYAYHGGKPNLRSECEKYLCRCIWDDHTTGSKRSRLHRRSAPDRSMRQKRQAAPVKKERPSTNAANGNVQRTAAENTIIKDPFQEDAKASIASVPGLSAIVCTSIPCRLTPEIGTTLYRLKPAEVVIVLVKITAHLGIQKLTLVSSG